MYIYGYNSENKELMGYETPHCLFFFLPDINFTVFCLSW